MTRKPMNDYLSRCDRCRVVTPHDQLIQVPHGWFCSYECAYSAEEQAKQPAFD